MLKIPNITHRVETDRFGPFTFQVGLNAGNLLLPWIRVEDAHKRFIASPLSQVASELEREVLVQSVHGTNTIEGAQLTEQQTADVLDRAPKDIAVDFHAKLTQGFHPKLTHPWLLKFSYCFVDKSFVSVLDSPVF